MKAPYLEELKFLRKRIPIAISQVNIRAIQRLSKKYVKNNAFKKL
jgi:hypothetical protein